MKRFLLLALVATTLIVGGLAGESRAEPRRRADRNAHYQAQRMPWHGEYYHTASGYPVPLVVPPTANSSTEWSWGVAQSGVYPIYHQYRRGFTGDCFGADGSFHPTPAWPSHTRQFGVYYIRSPW